MNEPEETNSSPKDWAESAASQIAKYANECCGRIDGYEEDVCQLALGLLREAEKRVWRDAERYRWLRQQHWSSDVLAVVANPKDAIKLGHDSPSLERLDNMIDAAMGKSHETE